ncbi:MarR family winged helix-turn-helix transcriptional regulator [Cryobacterium serini]|uniref:MarR family transcriptional regulator n=1 Tax=Cryobacterium serini TaxID=1259201 RepID=A0A4R9BM18_9MICO|nr:MarR family transcriptional regulator [Cryobacterium serini]TFD85993.1 MarR family transcriptional regulator [Cryobacterium serini]
MTIITTDAAVAAVEEQMTVLAGNIRASMRDTALFIDPALQPFGLKLLRTLERCGPTHAGALAENLVVDKSIISRQARALHDLGLIKTQTDDDDGRVKYFALTPLAVKKLAEVRASKSTRLLGRLQNWSGDDLTRFAELLARLNTPD